MQLRHVVDVRDMSPEWKKMLPTSLVRTPGPEVRDSQSWDRLFSSPWCSITRSRHTPPLIQGHLRTEQCSPRHGGRLNVLPSRHHLVWISFRCDMASPLLCCCIMPLWLQLVDSVPASPSGYYTPVSMMGHLLGVGSEAVVLVKRQFTRAGITMTGKVVVIWCRRVWQPNGTFPKP